MTRKPTISRKVLNATPGAASEDIRTVPGEVPVALTYNGMSHVVLMATPKDLEDLAAGFTLSEGIVERYSDIAGIELVEAESGVVAKITIPKSAMEALIERPRNLVGQTGCGLCGVEDLENAVRSYPPITARPAATKKAVFEALDALGALQPVNRETGAVHAAAFVSPQGIEAAFEDVGRHNAFDKLIGHMAKAGKPFEAGFVLLTSRCSFELVQKALAVRAPMLVTISAPTDLAADLAEAHGLTLVALARKDSVLVINDPFGIMG